jgi:hypothetical protein
MYSACPPNRAPWANSTPAASWLSIVASTAIVYDRFLMFGATDSGTSEVPG